jgi:hypothetical protein
MRHLVPMALLLCLTVTAPAEAKEVLSAKVCGASGCETSRDPVDPPKAAAPFFRVRLTIGEETGR